MAISGEPLVSPFSLKSTGGAQPWGSAGSRRLSYITKVQFNGNLLLGKAYTAQLGHEQIEILPIGTADEEE